jgi:hypothetical protein
MAPFSKSLAAGAKQAISSGSTRQVDILFVVDNSFSMAEEQAGLDENFSLFLEQLINANADFRLGVVSTAFTTDNRGYFNNLFKVDAIDSEMPQDYKDDVKSILKVDDAKFAELSDNCRSFFDANYKYSKNEDETSVKMPWIYSGNKVFDDIRKIEDKAERSKKMQEALRDLFRCEFALGTKGDGIERGLINTVLALENTDFKRRDSLLAIVFVTDENDCSNVKMASKLISDTKIQNAQNASETNLCELYRNIEDSCTITSDDYVDRADTESASSLVPSSGQLLTILGSEGEAIPSKTLRQWCVQGDKEARDVLSKCYNAYKQDPSSCAVGRYINCPEEGCYDVTNESGEELTHRSDFFDRIVREVAIRNAHFYGTQNQELKEKADEIVAKDNVLRDHLHSGSASQEDLAQERADIANKLTPFLDFAKEDVIVASILNRDRGVRYNTRLSEEWCGSAGTQGYRYQLFAEMFNNDPIYAPICCMGDEEFYSKTESVGEVCAPNSEFGQLATFGPVLGAIGRRIGEAVNTMCTEAPPITCKPDECVPGSEKASCPCNHGCSDKAYMEGTDNEYHLCNEFEMKIGHIPHISDPDPSDEVIENAFKNYEAFVQGKDYEVVYDSTYCLSRTKSPIQILMNVNEPGTDLIIEYPKKVSGKVK